MQTDAAFKKAILLVAGNNLLAAEAACRQALRLDAKDINNLALLGAILLKQNRIEEAEALLLESIELAPGFATPHQDLAILYINRKDFASAIKYFNLAIEIDPSLSSSYSGLSHALRKIGDYTGATAVLNKYAELTPENPLARAIAMQQSGDLKNARIECGRLLAQEPGNLAAMRRLALISAEEGQHQEAERMFRHISDIAPESVIPMLDLANLNLQKSNYPRAISWLERAAKQAPNEKEISHKLAQTFLMIGNADESLRQYSICLSRDPNDSHATLGKGNALRALGHGNEAIESYQQGLLSEKTFANACWCLASMRTYEFSDRQLQQMTEHQTRANTSAAATHLDFALGKAQDDRGNYSRAWQHYRSGNARHRQEIRFDMIEFEQHLDAIISTYSDTFCNRCTASMDADVIPIFIVGMPRSGSTLIEQILASHPEVESTAELPYLIELAKAVNVANRDQPLPVVDLQEKQLNSFGVQYLSSTEVHRTEKKRYFIDKLPSNFPYVGFIHLILPQAVIIDARRSPVDTCVANFRQLYALGKEFSYDLDELPEFYLQYHRIMTHWQVVLPQKVLRVNYEGLVADQEQVTRKILDHCGLNWDSTCLNFQFTQRTFSTASSEQVQQPLYSHSVGFWRHYDDNLVELIENLKPIINEDPTFLS